MKQIARSLSWLLILLIGCLSLLSAAPPVQAQARCGFWALEGKPAEKDLRIQVGLKILNPKGADCTGRFSLHDDTSVFDKTAITSILGASGYTLELQRHLQNATLTWIPPTLYPKNITYLNPALDIDFLPAPIDPTKEARVTISGDMTLEALKIDITLFLYRVIMQIAANKVKKVANLATCALQPDKMILVAIRAGSVAGDITGLAFKGHIPSYGEAKQLVDDFIAKSYKVLKDIGYNCAAKLIEVVLGSPITILRVAATYLGLFAVWFIDYIRYQGESANFSLVYTPPKQPTPVPIEQPTTLAAVPSTGPTDVPAPVPVPTPTQAQIQAPPAGASGPGPVMAFYYPWYEPADWESGKMSDVAAPTYSGGDDEAMRRHIQQAADAGIDALACAWSGPNEERINTRCHRLLQLIAESGRPIRMAIFPDPASFAELYTPAKMAEALNVIRDEFISSPAYLTWQEKPVIFFYHPPSLGDLNAWKQLRDQADPNHAQIWLGGTDDFSYLDVYDALFYFDISWEKSDGAAMASYANRLKNYNQSHNTTRPFIATTQPGYDDTLYRGPGHVVRDRANGDYYRGTWQTAIKRHAAAVVLTSFNEFYEGSYIEPSSKFGDQYLQITREMIAQYRN